MRTKQLLSIFTILAFSSIGSALAQQRGKGKGKGPARPGMTLTTPAFADGTEIPPKYTQGVSDPVSPKLEWTNVPPGVESFTLILHDPDVAIGKKTGDVLHWMIFNIPGTARDLPEGVPAQAQLPDGAIQAVNTHKTVGYVGMGAPAAGPYHHYTFEL
ncbi:MAG: YbhB/YbcL family Raf kinase inhibitor-like protein, partial [bacterium]